ncbi:HTH-type transcriptional regulator MhqR [bacterium BMS3Abin04]|nr:HTH-type transcriptional regulator MhqR [bacterium BMS3Abin04]
MTARNLAQEMSSLTCELARACNEKEKKFAAQFNLTPAEFRCLRLFSNNDALPIKFLTKSLGITPGRTTHILTSLEEKRLVKRKADQKDKRNMIVELTAKSKPFIKNLNENHIKIHEEILQHIKKNDREIIIKAIQEVIDALSMWTDKKK